MLVSRLKQCRTAQHMSIRDLSARSGVDLKTIRSLEHNRVLYTIRWNTMRKLASALGLSVNAVFPNAKA